MIRKVFILIFILVSSGVNASGIYADSSDSNIIGRSPGIHKLYELGWLKPGSALDNTIHNRSSVSRIYAKQNYQLIWFDPAASEQLEGQLSLIHYADISPFFSYRYEKLLQLKKQHMLFEYDLLATDTLISYIDYATRAVKQGEKWYFNGEVDINLKNQQDINPLLAAINKQRLQVYIRSYSPVNFRFYYRAVRQLQESSGTEQEYIQPGIRKPGDILANKSLLMEKLAITGLNVKSSLVKNNRYDADLAKLVKAYQKQHGLEADGIIGDDTKEWLNLPVDERLRILALNAERTRLMPKKLDSVIVVNVPNFRMSYWFKGKAVFRSRVIVGQQERKTPLLNVHLDSMIVNPSWNVPKKLVYKDILPKIKGDLSYLERNNFKILKGGFYGEEVDPQSIDWSRVSDDYFPYQIRQDTGHTNALGRYKFNTPNSKAIYLHDTPSKYLFGRNSRAYSSGCIRVQHAEKFASVLLETQGISTDIQEIEQSNNKHAIAMKKAIPVKIVYQTAWYSSGYINYRKDIYQYDGQRNDLIVKK